MGALEGVELALACCRDPSPGPLAEDLARLEEILAGSAAALADPARQRDAVVWLYVAAGHAATVPAPGAP